MSLNTRAISGGVTPRFHEPKKKLAAKKKLTTKKTTKGKNKPEA
jgi:hypothetical protein